LSTAGFSRGQGVPLHSAQGPPPTDGPYQFQ